MPIRRPHPYTHVLVVPHTLGVIGLGAIGGSLAWQAARSGVPRVVGYAADRRDGAEAARAGAVSSLETDVPRVVAQVDLLVLATPPRATLGLLEQIGPLVLRRPDVLVTDVCSVKRPVVDCAERTGLVERFAGSHPFAGTHLSGFAAARVDRFRGAVAYVTPCPGGEDAAREVADFWERVLEAQPVIMPADQHDTLLAWTSHLPQAAASALAATLARAAPEGARFGTGARDATRIAASGTEMWVDILLLNREHVLESLHALGESVEELAAALRAGDGDAVGRWLARGAVWRRGARR